MLKLTISSPQKKITSLFSFPWIKESKQEPVYNPIPKTVFQEALRRDKIIKEEVSKLTYKAGDIVTPDTEKHRNEYGDKVEVKNIMTSYHQFGKNEKWPEDDRPLIVTGYSLDKKVTFFCTVNYLKPL